MKPHTSSDKLEFNFPQKQLQFFLLLRLKEANNRMRNPLLEEKLISTGLQLSRDHVKICGLSYELQSNQSSFKEVYQSTSDPSSAITVSITAGKYQQDFWSGKFKIRERKQSVAFLLCLRFDCFSDRCLCWIPSMYRNNNHEDNEETQQNHTSYSRISGSQNYRGWPLQVIYSKPLLKAASATSGCSGLSLAELQVFPRMKTPLTALCVFLCSGSFMCCHF